MEGFDAVQQLTKAMGAGGYGGAPDTLTQNSALQIEDLSPTMNLVTYDKSHIKVQNKITVTSCKSTTAQFDRQLSYGDIGNGAQIEGQVGNENTSDYVRVIVPMCYYAQMRNVSIASTMVATVDGKKSDERAAEDAAISVATDVEFDLLRGKDGFTNAGVFDASIAALPVSPAMQGIACQVRQSDAQSNARDLAFAEYGNDESVVLAAGGALSQNILEDSALRSSLNWGTADKLLIDPVTLANYNKLVWGKERIMLAGSPQTSTGGDLKSQWVSGGSVELEATNFMRGKHKPARARGNGPGAPTVSNAVAAAGTTMTAGTYIYYVTTRSPNGESPPSATSTATGISAGDKVTLTITHGSALGTHFNVYRTAVGGAAATAKYIGSVAFNAAGTTTTFVDLNNRLPGFVTGLLLQKDTMEIRELAPYSRLKLAVAQLNMPEAFFRFLTLSCPQVRKNVIVDNLAGAIS